MKILLTFPQPEIFDGFVKLLGPEKVISYPHIFKWENPPTSRVPKEDKRFIEINELNEMKTEFDLIVTNYRQWDMRCLTIIKDILKWNTSSPIVITDLSEMPIISPVCFHPKISLYFKRRYSLPNLKLNLQFSSNYITHILKIIKNFLRMTKTRNIEINIKNISRLRASLLPSALEKIKPLPYCAMDNWPYNGSLNKQYDFSFLMYAPPIYHAPFGERVQLYRFLKRYSKKKKIKPYLKLLFGSKYGNVSRLPWIKYMEIIEKSWLSFSCRGGQFDSWRYWEIPYSGAILVSEYPKSLIPNNFIDGYNAIFYTSFKELKKKLDYYLENYDELKKIAKRGREHVLKYHTSKTRAKYIINNVKKFMIT
jgi:hypothetical protein